MIVLVDRSYTTSYQWSIVLYLLWLCGIGFDMFNRVCYLAKILGLARPRPSSLEPGSARPYFLIETSGPTRPGPGLARGPPSLCRGLTHDYTGLENGKPHRVHLFTCTLSPALTSVTQFHCTVMTSLGNSGLYWTVFAWNRDTAVPAEGHDDLQTLICVLVVRLRQRPTLPNLVLW